MENLTIEPVKALMAVFTFVLAAILTLIVYVCLVVRRFIRMSQHTKQCADSAYRLVESNKITTRELLKRVQAMEALQEEEPETLDDPYVIQILNGEGLVGAYSTHHIPQEVLDDLAASEASITDEMVSVSGSNHDVLNVAASSLHGDKN